MSIALVATTPRTHFGLRATPPAVEDRPVLRWRGHVTIAEEGRAKGATLSAPLGAMKREAVYQHLLAEIAAWAGVDPDLIEDDEEGGFRLGGVLLATFVVEPHYVMPFVSRPALAHCTMKVVL